MADAEKLDEARMELKLPPLNVHLTQGMLKQSGTSTKDTNIQVNSVERVIGSGR